MAGQRVSYRPALVPVPCRFERTWRDGGNMQTTKVRGQLVTREDVLQAMKRFDKEYRASFPQRKWVRYAIEHYGQHYPPKTILRMIVGGSIPGGGKPVNSRFEDLAFKVVTLDEPPEGGMDDDEDAADTALSLESDLENSLLKNLGQLEKGLKLYTKGSITGQQLQAGSAGRLDLLGVDSSDCLVVIELKAGEADRQVCGQIQAYMGWVKENLAGKRRVRGIIVANEFTDRTRYAAAMVPNLASKKYEVIFKFSDGEN